MSEQWRIQHGGDGEPVLLSLHGLGATADVWHGLHAVLRGRWPGRVYQRAWAHADATIATLALDATGQVPWPHWLQRLRRREVS